VYADILTNSIPVIKYNFTVIKKNMAFIVEFFLYQIMADVFKRRNRESSSLTKFIEILYFIYRIEV
jgi:hypothetical protein